MKKIPIRQINSNHLEQNPSDRFSIRKVEDLFDGENLFQQLHRHDFFFILALQIGKGIHEIDFIKHAVLDHSIFILRPGQVHQLELKAGCTGFLMEFNNGFYHPTSKLLNQRLRRASNTSFCLLDVNRYEKLHNVLTYISQEYTEHQEDYQEIIKANLDIFFIELNRQSSKGKNPSTSVNPYQQERFEAFLDLLHKHVTAHKQVSHYAELMNLSTYQLNGITKAAIGKTAVDLIYEHIILEAKRFLLATSDQIKEIAALLGYEDVSYFIRLFRRHTGYSPEAFRRNPR